MLWKRKLGFVLRNSLSEQLVCSSSVGGHGGKPELRYLLWHCLALDCNSSKKVQKKFRRKKRENKEFQMIELQREPGAPMQGEAEEDLPNSKEKVTHCQRIGGWYVMLLFGAIGCSLLLSGCEPDLPHACWVQKPIAYSNLIYNISTENWIDSACRSPCHLSVDSLAQTRQAICPSRDSPLRKNGPFGLAFTLLSENNTLSLSCMIMTPTPHVCNLYARALDSRSQEPLVWNLHTGHCKFLDTARRLWWCGFGVCLFSGGLLILQLVVWRQKGRIRVSPQN